MDNHILPILGNITFDNINSKIITAWQTELIKDDERNISVKTVRECRTVLKVILTTARLDGYLSKDVFEGVKRLPRHEKSVRGILTESEVRSLFDKQNFSLYWKDNILYMEKDHYPYNSPEPSFLFPDYLPQVQSASQADGKNPFHYQIYMPNVVNL